MFNKPVPIEVITVGGSFREQILGIDECYLCPETLAEEKLERQKESHRVGLSFWQRRRIWPRTKRAESNL